MEKLIAFQRRMSATSHYYPKEYDVAINKNKQTGQWTLLSIRMDNNHAAELKQILQATDDGHIYRVDGYFTN